MGRTSSTVKDRYNAKAYDEIKVRVSKGKKDTIQTHAEQQGQSVNAYINAAIDEKMCRDDLEGHTAASAGGMVSVYSESKKAAPAASESLVEGAAGNSAERRGNNE